MFDRSLEKNDRGRCLGCTHSIFITDFFSIIFFLFITNTAFPQSWIVNVTPTQNAIGVNDSTDIAIFFNRKITENTLNDTTVIINGSVKGVYRSESITYDTISNSVKIRAIKNFTAGEIVTLILTMEIRDIDSTKMMMPYVWNFTIETSNEGTGYFSQFSTIYSVTNPNSVVAGDFDEDTDLDLIALNFNSNSFSILKNNGQGIFTPVPSGVFGNGPNSVIAGDFDQNGSIDIAVVYMWLDTVSVFMNDGNGLFRDGAKIKVGNFPIAITSADLDGDGDLDLAVTNMGNLSRSVSILKNDGIANFTQVSILSVGNSPTGITHGDFDEDGDLDLATVAYTSTGQVTLLMNDGNGNFTLSLSDDGRESPSSITNGDFDGDGDLDLAIANFGSTFNSGVSIMKNDGGGDFSLVSVVATENLPLYSIISGDFNGDNFLDLAVSTTNEDTPPDKIIILKNDGYGNFEQWFEVVVGDRPISMTTGDFNSDGDLDIAVVGNSSRDVTILSNLKIPIFSVSSPSVYFHEVGFGFSQLDSVFITNSGNEILRISSVSSNDLDFIIFPESAIVLPSGSKKFYLTFNPTSNGYKSSEITFLHNGLNSPTKIMVSGNAVNFSLSNSYFDFQNVSIGFKKLDSLVMTNLSSSNHIVYPVNFGVTEFSVEPESTMIRSLESQKYYITYKPMSFGYQSGYFIFNDSSTNPPVIGVNGRGTIDRIVNEGWNMVSIPVTVSDYRKSILFPEATSPAYGYINRYHVKDSLANGEGYWIKFPTSEIVSIFGNLLVEDSILVSEGWNIIGVPSVPFPIDSIKSVPANIITSQFIGFNINYEVSDSLLPLNAYWVKVNQNGLLVLKK